MFKRLPEAEGAAVAVTIDGEPFNAREGDSVAAALLAAGRTYCRETPISGAKRAPYCMMGVCFDCLVTVDGVGNRQGCLVRVQDGMCIETQHSKRALGELGS
ncbi:MAG: (2Fe-2S)-binding protein [Pseudolabrys sp.]